MVMACAGPRQRPHARTPTTALQQALVVTALLASMAVARPEPPPDGYRFELIHVDAGRGFSDDVLMQRAFERGRRWEEALLPPSSFVSPTKGNPKGFDYFIEFYIGVGGKKVNISAVVDTGSNLIWTTEDKCTKSNTVTNLPCGDKCQHANCRCESKVCRYDVKYGGNRRWSTSGVIRLAQLMFQLASGDRPTITFDDVAIGCSTTVDFPDKSITGILGLGRGGQSLQKQLSMSDNFGYCLSAYTKPGVLLIGGPAPASAAVVTTGLRKNPRYETYYFVQLEKISIGGTQLPIPDNTFKQQDGGGNMFVDSGASYTFLVKEAYDKVVDEVGRVMKSKNRQRLPPEKTKGNICYQGSPDESMPDMVLHFAGGAKMVLPWRSYLLESTTGPSLCLTLKNSKMNLSILGNFQQQGMHIHFDMEKEQMSFVRTDDCSKV